MTQRTLYARFTAQEGKGAEVAAILGELIPLVQREDGLQFYVLNRGLEDADIVWFYEVYADDEALAAHGKFPEFREVFGRVMPLTVGPPEIIRSEIVGMVPSRL